MRSISVVKIWRALLDSLRLVQVLVTVHLRCLLLRLSHLLNLLREERRRTHPLLAIFLSRDWTYPGLVEASMWELSLA